MNGQYRSDPLAILRHPALSDYPNLARNGGSDLLPITESQLVEASAALVQHSWRGFADQPGKYLARAIDPCTHTIDDTAVRACIARDSFGRCWVFCAADSEPDHELMRRIDAWEAQP